MIRAGTVIQEGVEAYEAGRSINACPYEAPEEPIIVEGYHGPHPIGDVRVGIDYQNLWQIGWKIGWKIGALKCKYRRAS